MSATPSDPPVDAPLVTSGHPGHERAVPAYEIPPPTENVGPRFVTAFAFAQLALFVALLGPVMVSMAIKVTSVVGSDAAPAATGLILGVGALAALFGNPIFGRLSDRTTSRWGRRRPWLVGGSVGLAVCLLVIAVANSVPVLMIGWFVGQLAANAAFAAYLASVADQVPPRQQATITALAGVMQNVGILVAVYIASALTANMLGLFMVPAVIGVIGMTIYALVLPDQQLHQRPPAEGLRSVLQTFWVSPRRYPDFAWAWVSRFMLILGMFLFTTFRIFWMTHELGLDEAGAAGAVATGTLIYTIALVVVGQTAGYISDRIGRRKVLVFASTALFAVGLGLLPTVETVTGFYVVEAILGAAFGIYMGADLALVLAVLPNPQDSAKDLGVFNIANAAPQSLAPFLGSVLVGVGGGHNYTLVYLTAAVATFIGALAIIPVKGVK